MKRSAMWCLASPLAHVTCRAWVSSRRRFHETGIAFFASCAVFNLATFCLHAATTSTAVDPSSVTIPSEHGYLGDPHAGTKSGAPVIIHIQEAHANFDTQKHLVAILEHLIQRYGVRLILVEGGTGDVSLRYFRDYGSPERRKQVADKYLRAGILSAEEYLDIVSEHPLILWGVEDRRLYHRNWQMMQDGELLRDSFTPFLTQVREAATQLKPQLLSASSRQLDEARAAFDRDEMGLTAYAGVLWNLATQQQVDTSAYDEVARFVAVSQQEKRLNLSEVQTEQQTLVQHLQQVADEEALTTLADAANALKAGSVPRVEFYEVLVDLATRHGIALDASPHLTDYLAYLRESKKIRPGTLSDQLEQLATALRTASSGSSPESRQLTKVLDELMLIERLVATELSPDEYQRFRRLSTPGLLCGWEQFLERQLRLEGLEVPRFAGCDALEAQVPQLARFYETASERDRALVQHAIEKLRDASEPLAVLITGGFHSPEITRLLTAQGLGVVTVTPKVETPSDPAVYQAVLRYKQGLMTLDQVMAVTHPSTAQRMSGR